MGIELLVPAVQNGNKAQFATQSVFGIMAKAQQGLGYGLEKDVE